MAFPNISTGVYRFPKELAAATAIDAVRLWADSNPGLVDSVVFVCFDDDNLQLYATRLTWPN